MNSNTGLFLVFSDTFLKTTEAKTSGYVAKNKCSRNPDKIHEKYMRRKLF